MKRLFTVVPVLAVVSQGIARAEEPVLSIEVTPVADGAALSAHIDGMRRATGSWSPQTSSSISRWPRAERRGSRSRAARFKAFNISRRRKGT